ncbi:FAD-dependent oxidoreductase [Amycolatopsis decaplanina]|uniref:Putative dehydrogenase flavoprotein n=1 Tax=Amycolatopsis decaplanina DSM 44594 TaxID=1284240 RepID=M2YUR6_9PSEU|nr:FAD-dependent oxidoreductase [Amycolatopsis decaplanina]EME65690.1 putative dehydrogenase flavoprotein [Amycolatopsis decaplanina DSM 44594]
MVKVIVLGSGAAGLAAALAAREAGAEVTLAEATSTIGGTTALSSGAVWVPGNHVHADGSIVDSIEQARLYLDSLDLGDTAPALLEHYLAEAPRVLRRLEAATALRWQPLPYPDCHRERPGGMGSGVRSLEPLPLKVPATVSALIRPSSAWRPPLTVTEMVTGAATPQLVSERSRTGTLVGGQAMVAALLKAVLDAGVDVRTSTRVTYWSPEGVVVDGERQRARVVLATGGFERDSALLKTFLRAPVRGLIGAPGSRGDGLRLAMSAGAALGTMSEAWWCPCLHVPGDEIDGEPVHRMLFAERARPGVIMVDQRGRRFTNEAQSYNDVGRAMHAFSSRDFRFEADPSWMVFDAEARGRHAFGSVRPGEPEPEWLLRAGTTAELAGLIGVDPAGFVETVDRFNENAKAGADPEFGRGGREYDSAGGEPTLRPLSEPPYFAVAVHAGLGGTKGGPKTDEHGRVTHVDGSVIPGLYAAGNAAASPFGMAYPGTGTTLGQALTFGDSAGRAAATD